MKTLKFKEYVRDDNTLESAGTVGDLIGAKGKLGYWEKNFNNHEKQVVLWLTNETGGTEQITCSKAVSKGLRDKSITLGHVKGFEVLWNEDLETYFISMPAGAGLTYIASKDLKIKTWEPAEINHEDLIAL